MRIFALFDDPDAIQKARDVIEKEGRGDEVVKVVSPHLDADQTQPAPVMGSGQSISGPAVVNQAGQTAPRGTPDAAVAVLGRLNLPVDQREYFERELRKEAAQVLVLETEDEDAEETLEMLKEHGAQYVTHN